MMGYFAIFWAMPRRRNFGTGRLEPAGGVPRRLLAVAGGIRCDLQSRKALELKQAVTTVARFGSTMAEHQEPLAKIPCASLRSPRVLSGGRPGARRRRASRNRMIAMAAMS